MSLDLANKPISTRFQHLLKVMQSERFLQNKGLGNEIPFFICTYKAKESLEMDSVQHKLIAHLDQLSIRVLKINLYDLSIQILKEREIWDRIIEIEKTISKNELKELLQSVLDPEQNLVPAIMKIMEQNPYDVMFLSGIGEIFPYIRSHNVLNNLQSKAHKKPMVLFFPGEYTHSPEKGASLDLFGKLHDDKYYRAFNIYHFEV